MWTETHQTHALHMSSAGCLCTCARAHPLTVSQKWCGRFYSILLFNSIIQLFNSLMNPYSVQFWIHKTQAFHKMFVKYLSTCARAHPFSISPKWWNQFSSTLVCNCDSLASSNSQVRDGVPCTCARSRTSLPYISGMAEHVYPLARCSLTKASYWHAY